VLTRLSTFVEDLTKPEKGPCTNNPLCIAGKQNEPLLNNIRRGLIDPDTPKEFMTRTSYNGEKQVLVFSDEFNTDGRTFYDGDDPFFQAVDIWYGATMDLEVSFEISYLNWPALTSRSGTTQTKHSLKTAFST
jgi:beta-glucanase (GH16 family)